VIEQLKDLGAGLVDGAEDRAAAVRQLAQDLDRGEGREAVQP
jgi:hypothetical protein